MRPLRPIGAGQFVAFRVLLGTYLFLHFCALWAWSPEIFSRAGFWPEASLSPLTRAFPNILTLWDQPWQVHVFVGVLGLLSLLLIVGWKRPWVCVALWYGWTCLFVRQPLIGNPGLHYIGLIFLLCALVPEGEGRAWGRPADKDWRFLGEAWGVAFWLLMVGYTFSGYYKVLSPSWMDGEALRLLAENPLARPGICRDLILAMPKWLQHALTYGALLLELLAFPLCLWKPARLWVWLALISMHLGILTTVAFADLTIGVLMAHAFTYDPGWNRPRRRGQTLFYDGVCGLCDRTVQTLLSLDRDGVLRYAPLQGLTAAAQLPAEDREALSTLIYQADGQLLKRGRAVRAILIDLGGPLALLGWALYAVPRPLLDAGYSFVAARRLDWFGRLDSCRLPRPEEKERFLP